MVCTHCIYNNSYNVRHHLTKPTIITVTPSDPCIFCRGPPWAVMEILKETISNTQARALIPRLFNVYFPKYFRLIDSMFLLLSLNPLTASLHTHISQIFAHMQREISQLFWCALMGKPSSPKVNAVTGVIMTGTSLCALCVICLLLQVWKQWGLVEVGPEKYWFLAQS